jgi:DNA polymerase III sliding clamp (beta) subunit (PCNA family)
MEVSASNQLLGENRYQVVLKKKKIEGLQKVVFNWKYLLDAVKVMPEAGLSIGFAGEGKPALISSTGDKSLIYVVMPIQQ